MRTAIFVDGENFRFSIVDLFKREFRKDDYLPKNAKWAEFFDYLTVYSPPTREGERIRTYWYVLEHIDFYPYRLRLSDRDKLERILSKHPVFRDEIRKATSDAERQTVMERQVRDLKRHEEKMRSRFEGWKKIQDAISLKHFAIEFRRAGSIVYDLFEGQLRTEKAVDVMLATDMITLRDIYDTALIVSGDQDYTPAVQKLKDLGKRVINVSFMTPNNIELPGGAWRLNKETDGRFAVKHREMKQFMQL